MKQIRLPSKSVSCGSDFTMIVSEDGLTYACGKNTHGQLGLDHQRTVQVPTPVKSMNKKILGVCCGFEFTYFLSKELEVLSCGRNEYGQLAHGNTTDLLTPLVVTGLGKVLNISCGDSHVLFLKKDGSVLSCGYNGHGELGINSSQNKTRPVLITFPKDVKTVQIGCGEYHSFFLSERGELWGCGSNKYGRLGMGVSTKCIIAPTMIKIPNDERAIQFSLGSANSYILTEKLQVYACGYNSRNQLGYEDTKDRAEFIRVRFPDDVQVEHISAGGFSYNCFFLTTTGRVYACGFNRYGQLGDGKKAEKQSLKEIPMPSGQERIVQIASSGHHSFFMLESGKVRTTGRNHNGQLGVNDLVDRMVSTSVNLPEGVTVPVDSGTPIIVHDTKEDKLREEMREKLVAKYSAKDTKLSPEYFCIKFESNSPSSSSQGLQKSVNICCSYAIQAGFFLTKIERREYSTKIPGVFAPAVFKVKEWLMGRRPSFNSSEVLRLTYSLSKRWGMSYLSKFVVTTLQVLFCSKVKELIDLIFELEEQGMRKSGLFLQCQHLLKRNYKLLVQKYAPYCLSKKTQETETLYFELLSLFFHELPPLSSHGDFTDVDKEFNLHNNYQKHLSGLIDLDITKNLILHTTDDRNVKVHKEIMIRNPYFKSLLVGGFQETLQQRRFRIVDIALDSNILVPLVLWIYKKEIKFELYEYKYLSMIQNCAKKFCMNKLKRVCKEEFTRRFVYNTFSERDIRKILLTAAESQLENMMLKFDLRSTQKRNKFLEEKLKDRK